MKKFTLVLLVLVNLVSIGKAYCWDDTGRPPSLFEPPVVTQPPVVTPPPVITPTVSIKPPYSIEPPVDYLCVAEMNLVRDIEISLNGLRRLRDTLIRTGAKQRDIKVMNTLISQSELALEQAQLDLRACMSGN